jgi:hypothetical protein
MNECNNKDYDVNSIITTQIYCVAWPFPVKSRLMPQKRTISFRIDPALADRFQKASAPYLGKHGACLGAAMLMFLEADPKVQGQYLKKLYDAEINDEVEVVIDAARGEQLRRIKAREHKEK